MSSPQPVHPWIACRHDASGFKSSHSLGITPKQSVLLGLYDTTSRTWATNGGGSVEAHCSDYFRGRTSSGAYNKSIYEGLRTRGDSLQHKARVERQVTVVM